MIPKFPLVYEEIKNDADFRKVRFCDRSYLTRVVACLRVLRHEKVEIVIAVPENMYSLIFLQSIVDQNVIDAFRELFVPIRVYFREQIIHGMLKLKYRDVWQIAYSNVYITGRWY